MNTTANTAEPFARMIAGMDFIGPDLTFQPKEDTYEYGRRCAVSFLDTAADTICGADKADLPSVTAALVAGANILRNTVDTNSAAGAGFIDGFGRFIELVLKDKEARGE